MTGHNFNFVIIINVLDQYYLVVDNAPAHMNTRHLTVYRQSVSIYRLYDEFSLLYEDPKITQSSLIPICVATVTMDTSYQQWCAHFKNYVLAISVFWSCARHFAVSSFLVYALSLIAVCFVKA
ncbi:hypothetical protein AB4K20DRAFT_1869790 [Rhizopus microsporus]|uniref:Uncharacterized protein n=1 Tax=Rhizopus microsporus TaxID=58291 RepID=A0A1X0RV57_RHIZD|nr:hypothetical protein BCV71DRAFT_237263 [Rhizopus microsporus]